MARNIYKYKGREFYSIKALAQYVHINDKTLTARLRRGMSVEDACDTANLNHSYYKVGNVEKSLTQICDEQKKDIALVRNRLQYGYSLNDALNKPKKISRQGIPIVVNGTLYNSISDALRSLNLINKESLVRRRLKAGIKPDEAFNVKD